MASIMWLHHRWCLTLVWTCKKGVYMPDMKKGHDFYKKQNEMVVPQLWQDNKGYCRCEAGT